MIQFTQEQIDQLDKYFYEPRNLVDLFEGSAAKWADRPSIGQKDPNTKTVCIPHLPPARGADQQPSRRAEEARPPEGRNRGRHTEQFNRMVRPGKRDARPGRPLHPDVREGAGEEMALHDQGQRGQVPVREEPGHPGKGTRLHRGLSQAERDIPRLRRGRQVPAGAGKNGKRQSDALVQAALERDRRHHLHLRHDRRPEGRGAHPREPDPLLPVGLEDISRAA